MSARPATQPEIDRANQAFWDELCGSKFALENGVTDNSPESIARFDRAYFDFYPYLEGYIPSDIAGKRTLEIGLGYGSLSQRLAELGADYHGLDIARGPVEMVRERLRRIGVDGPEARVQQGSALEIPHPDASLDCVVSIGCLHVTGDFAGAIREVHRVLRPGGQAVVMVYAKHSFRRYTLAVIKSPYLLQGGPSRVGLEVDRVYDQRLDGEALPAMEYIGTREAKRAFEGFGEVEIRRENMDKIKAMPRQWLLGAPARVAGVDIYITATK